METMKLKDYRLKHGLTAEQLALAVGVTKATICRYEKGKRKPKDEIMRKISEVTKGKVTPNDFY